VPRKKNLEPSKKGAYYSAKRGEIKTGGAEAQQQHVEIFASLMAVHYTAQLKPIGGEIMRIILLAILFVFTACSTTPPLGTDPYVWLEDVEGTEALKWVEEQNKESLAALASSPDYKKMESDALKILEAKDRIPSGYFQKKDIVNFWRDDVHVRGILRKTSYENYKKKNIPWETILDVDALAKKENENWIFKGMDCLEPAYQMCLVKLSRGGKDAVETREFDAKKKQFVKNGFKLPEAKAWVAWADKDTLLVGTDFGPGTLTESGYPRQVKLWKRGTKIETAKLVFEASPTDTWVNPMRVKHGGKAFTAFSRAFDFFNTEEYAVDIKTGEKRLMPKPPAAQFSGYFHGNLVYELRNPWNFGGSSYLPGAVISISEKAIGRDLKPEDVQLIFSPKENQSFAASVELKDKLVISILEDVKSQLLVTEIKDGKWQMPTALKLSGNGNIGLAAGTDEADLFMYFYENFNQPSTLYSFDFVKDPVKLKAMPDKFDAKNLVVKKKFATSKDGTKVPYFIVFRKGMALDGKAPTLQYGYGGFTVSQTPQYNAIVGKLWLERGGVYVVANIRGGGEYGPKWHQAALKENRQKAFDDFIAVSEDLIRNKITDPQHLAIRGGSNGGLLVGAVMAQRPDLYGAVLCWVPLLDMIKYSQLLAGASWMSEYGDPKISSNRKAILKYSPYHNVTEKKTYPPLLLVTSTKDDRVHPGHARKMAAKMKAQKHNVLYYENTEGGHAAGANLKQQARLNALQYSFLLKTISAPSVATGPASTAR